MARDTKSKRILKRYADGERVFPNLDRDDGTYDFNGADLTGVNFAEASEWGHVYGEGELPGR